MYLLVETLLHGIIFNETFIQEIVLESERRKSVCKSREIIMIGLLFLRSFRTENLIKSASNNKYGNMKLVAE